MEGNNEIYDLIIVLCTIFNIVLLIAQSLDIFKKDITSFKNERFSNNCIYIKSNDNAYNVEIFETKGENYRTCEDFLDTSNTKINDIRIHDVEKFDVLKYDVIYINICLSENTVIKYEDSIGNKYMQTFKKNRNNLWVINKRKILRFDSFINKL